MLLRLPWALVVNALRLVLLPLLLLRRRHAAPRGAWLTIGLSAGLVEVARRRPFWDRRPRPLALHDLRRLVRLAAADARVTGFLVTLDGLRGGMATARSLAEILASMKRSGKRVAVHLPDGAASRELYVGMEADVLLLGPGTHVGPLGFALQAPYFRDALARTGVEADVYARGDYKTAAEPLQRSEMSDAQREQVGAVLDDAFDDLVGAIAAGRRVPRETVLEWIDRGLWSARDAVHRGIADAVAHADEIPKKLEPKSKDGARLVDAGAYARRRSVRFVVPWRRPHVGVVEVNGAIVSSSPSLLVRTADEESVCHALDAAREDPRVRGVVLHVSSRGGSAVASERILHAARRLAAEKPLVAYLGDVAASGGYMVAVAARTIVAQPTSVTGSIGVVAVRPVLEPALGRLGIRLETVKRGARADLATSPRRLTDDERAAVESQIEDVYREFLQAVAQGRSRPVEAIEPLAGGRVWSGRRAAEHGLVDVLGGFDAALAEVRRLVGDGSEGLDVRVVGAGIERSPLAVLAPSFAADVVLGAAARPLPVSVAEWLTLCAFGRGEPLAWCPLEGADGPPPTV